MVKIIGVWERVCAHVEESPKGLWLYYGCICATYCPLKEQREKWLFMQAEVFFFD